MANRACRACAGPWLHGPNGHGKATATSHGGPPQPSAIKHFYISHLISFPKNNPLRWIGIHPISRRGGRRFREWPPGGEGTRWSRFRTLAFPSLSGLCPPRLQHFPPTSHNAASVFFFHYVFYTIEFIPNCDSWSSFVGVFNFYSCHHREPAWCHFRHVFS